MAETRTRKIDHDGREFVICFSEGNHSYRLVEGDKTTPVVGASSASKIVSDGVPGGWYERFGVRGAIAVAQGGFTIDDPEVVLSKMEERGLRWYQARDSAGDRGTSVHEWIARFIDTGSEGMDDLAEDAARFARSFLLWVEEEQPEFLASEQMVAHPDYHFAGTYDARVRLDNRECLVDFKTSKYQTNRGLIREEFHYQLAGYDFAARACGENPTDAQYIIWLHGDGSYPFVEKVVATAEDFIACLDLIASLKRIRKARKEQR